MWLPTQLRNLIKHFLLLPGGGLISDGNCEATPPVGSKAVKSNLLPIKRRMGPYEPSLGPRL